MRSRVLIYFVLVTAHLLAALRAPDAVAPVVAASVYGPLTAAQALSLPVFLKAESGGWPVPSFLDWVLVAFIWAAIWWGVASFLAHLITKYRAKA